MKRFALAVAVCGLFALGTPLWAQEAGNADSDAPSGETATVAPTTPPSLQEQVDELRAKLQELEAQLQKGAEAQESTSRDIYAINDAAAKLVTGPKLKFSGYVQAQVTDDRAASPKTDFQVRRARLKLEAPITDLASATLEFDATRSVSLKEAFIDLGRATDVWRVRAGQSKVPFMYDILQSSSARLAPEQTAVAQYVFPSEYDQGAWLQLKNALGDAIPGTTLDVGIQDGQGPNTADLNEGKDLVARLRFVLGNTPPDKSMEANSVYLGYLDGKFTKGTATTDKTAFGGGISYLLGPVWLRAEYLAGQKLGLDFTGWYGQAAYQFTNAVDTFFVRYDTLDENTDAPNTSVSDWTVGLEHFLDSSTRLILAHEFRSPESGYSQYAKTNGDLTTLRLQVKY